MEEELSNIFSKNFEGKYKLKRIIRNEDPFFTVGISDVRLNKKCCSKIIKKENFDEDKVAVFIKSIEGISNLKCKKIVQLVELKNIPKYFIMITNEFDYSLQSVNPVKYFEDKGCFKIIMDLCEAVKVMHSNNMICGNIKPSNIVFNGDDEEEYFLMDQCKDLLYSEGKYPLSNDSLNYIAPEILKGKETSKSADMWGVGGIIYFVLSGNPPFMGDSFEQVKNNILNGNLIRLKVEFSSILNPLMERLLNAQPYSRLTAEGLIKALDEIQSEWPDNSSIFQKLESILCCPICKELIQGAVILPCGHSYCSLCIRKFMEYNEECPTCRLKCCDGDLIKNNQLEELSHYFSVIKPQIISLLTNSNNKTDIDSKLPNTNTNNSRKPLAKVFYNNISLQRLKEMLQSCNLPITGSKEEMIRRHKDYILLYNSECDKITPLSEDEIVKKVIEQENQRNKSNNLLNKTRLNFFHSNPKTTSIQLGEIWRVIYSKKLDRILYYNQKDKILQENPPNQIKDFTNYDMFLPSNNNNINNKNEKEIIISLDKKEKRKISKIDSFIDKNTSSSSSLSTTDTTSRNNNNSKNNNPNKKPKTVTVLDYLEISDDENNNHNNNNKNDNQKNNDDISNDDDDDDFVAEVKIENDKDKKGWICSKCTLWNSGKYLFFYIYI